MLCVSSYYSQLYETCTAPRKSLHSDWLLIRLCSVVRYRFVQTSHWLVLMYVIVLAFLAIPRDLMWLSLEPRLCSLLLVIHMFSVG